MTSNMIQLSSMDDTSPYTTTQWNKSRSMWKKLVLQWFIEIETIIRKAMHKREGLDW